MMISFYEEFPTNEALDKLRLIDFPSKLYVAAKNLKEFYEIKKSVNKKNKKITNAAYWPVLSKEEGYWLSPFSETKAIERILNEIRHRKDKNKLIIMWDAELPLINKKLLFRNFFSFFRNKKTINDFFKNCSRYNVEIVTAEYAFSGFFIGFLTGTPTNIECHHTKMYYTSMINGIFLKNIVKNKIKNFVQKYKKYAKVAVGTTAKGVLGNEQILTPAELEEDLNFLKTLGVEEAIIFRLGGLNKRYVEVIKKFMSKTTQL